MKNKSPFEHLEQLNEYPRGFEPNLKTQRQLIESSVRKSSHLAFSRKFYFRVAVALLFIFGGWEFWSTRNTWTPLKNPEASISFSKPTVNADYDSLMVKVDRYDLGFSRPVIARANQVKGMELLKDTLVPLVLEEITPLDTVLADKGLTLTNSNDSDFINQKSEKEVIGIFQKKQRIKHFDFAPSKPVFKPKEEPAMEFFVFRDGGFKLLALPQTKHQTYNYSNH